MVGWKGPLIAISSVVSSELTEHNGDVLCVAIFPRFSFLTGLAFNFIQLPHFVCPYLSLISPGCTCLQLKSMMGRGQ